MEFPKPKSIRSRIEKEHSPVELVNNEATIEQIQNPDIKLSPEEVKTKTYIGRTKGVFSSDKARKTISYNINSKTVDQLNDLKNYWVARDIKNHTLYTLGYVMHLIVKEALDVIEANKDNPDYLVARFTVREKTNLKPKSFFIMNRDEFENDLNKARKFLTVYSGVELDRTKSIACFINGVHRKLIINS